MGIEPNTCRNRGERWCPCQFGSWCNRAGSGNNYDWNSSAVHTVVPTPITDPKIRTFATRARINGLSRGSSNNGGVVLRWFRDEFSCPEVEQAQQLNIDPYEIMLAAAASTTGSEGLLCLPFLSGERAPYWNANARGLFFGIGLHHKRSHFIRAVLEGILFSVYSIYIALRDLAGEAREIRAAGGFAVQAMAANDD